MSNSKIHTDVENMDIKDFIIVKEASTNNLKKISLGIKRNSLTVVTGLSGSGKSSFAFDTLYAEGRRMFIESLSAYSRQFLGKINKPDVKQILGISPTIAIEQKTTISNSRSIVGTVTEIYDYLKLLYARVGVTYSPISNQEVKKDSISSIVDYVCKLPAKSKILILYKAPKKSNISDFLAEQLAKGFSRIFVDDKVVFIEDLLKDAQNISNKDLYVVVDRYVIAEISSEFISRVSDAAQTTLFEGAGECIIYDFEKGFKYFSDKFELDGIQFEEPTVSFFGFNNPHGICTHCEGYGKTVGIDPEKVIPNKDLCVAKGAIAPWRTETMRLWLDKFLQESAKYDFPVYKPYKDLSSEQLKFLWRGASDVHGIDSFFNYLQSKSYKIQYRVLHSKYSGKIICSHCLGSRIRVDAQYVKIGTKSIVDLLATPIVELAEFFDKLALNEEKTLIAKRLLIEIKSRISYLIKVGLGYLTLNRETSTLSGGEYQRVMLANSLGSTLVGALYILDEPTIGLHPRDTYILAKILRDLQAVGNTVVVVEHEEEVMRIADEIIDIGPDSGIHGGHVVFQGDWHDLQNFSDSYTAQYLRGISKIEIPTSRRKSQKFITLQNCRENNLKGIDVNIPMQALTVITGVSGSGKSTLVEKILFPAISNHLKLSAEKIGAFDGLAGSFSSIDFVEYVSQNPIGKSSRSNPISYLKVYDTIRNLLAKTKLSIEREYLPSYFSYNSVGGRCEECNGEGVVTIDMQFMSDIPLICECCNGKRFKPDILEVQYNGKNIYEILNLTIDEALTFFGPKNSSIITKLSSLQDVGLGYIKLGQSTSTMSGGETQRLKIAFYLGKNHSYKNILFMFDEPTTGLHVHDTKKLLKSLNALVDCGHTVIVVEHNLEIVKSADYIIDLGPDSGNNGGELLFFGTPEDLIRNTHLGFTAKFLKSKLERDLKL